MKSKIKIFSTLLLLAGALQAAQNGTCAPCSELNSESFSDLASAELADNSISFAVQESTISSKDMVFLENGDIQIVRTEFDLFNGIRLEDETIAEEPYSGSLELPEVDPEEVSKGEEEEIQFEGSKGGGAVPGNLKALALEYFKKNIGKIGNKKYIAIIDFSKHSSKARFFIMKVEDESVIALHTSHGSGSDPDGDGYATLFSNVEESKKSSLGFYLTGDVYTGKHGKSMRLHGLSSTNSNALSRAVVIHEANYVREADVQAGRSWGCPAVAPEKIGQVIKLLKGGALIYAGLSGK